MNTGVTNLSLDTQNAHERNTGKTWTLINGRISWIRTKPWLITLIFVCWITVADLLVFTCWKKNLLKYIQHWWQGSDPYACSKSFLHLRVFLAQAVRSITFSTRACACWTVRRGSLRTKSKGGVCSATWTALCATGQTATTVTPVRTQRPPCTTGRVLERVPPIPLWMV